MGGKVIFIKKTKKLNKMKLLQLSLNMEECFGSDNTPLRPN